MKRLYDIFKSWTLPNMNDSDKTITETLNDDQKVDANKESTRRSSNDFDAMAACNIRAITRIEASMGGYL